MIDNYAKFLIKGYDSIQESFNVIIKEEWQEKFLFLRGEVENLNAPKTFNIGEFEFQMLPKGMAGYTYRFDDESFIIYARSGKSKVRDWQIVVRYTSQGLWAYGFNELNEKILKILNIISIRLDESERWRHLTRIDYCFDLYCPKFQEEAKPNLVNKVVAISRVKTKINGSVIGEKLENEKFAGWGIFSRVETLNIGTKNSLEISVYDKTREISEASGKTFFYDLWGEAYKKNVFRIEVRFFKEWLQAMHIITINDFFANAQDLINTALISRRLGVPSKDKNRSRWAIHPLWKCALEHNESNIIVPKLGKIVTLRPQALQNCYVAQMAGLLRNCCISKYGEINDIGIEEFIRNTVNTFYNDPMFDKKTKAVKEKQKLIRKTIR